MEVVLTKDRAKSVSSCRFSSAIQSSRGQCLRLHCESAALRGHEEHWSAGKNRQYEKIHDRAAGYLRYIISRENVQTESVEFGRKFATKDMELH